MKKTVKITSLVFCILLAGLIIWYWGVARVKIFPGARTGYVGYMEIEPMALSKIKTQLELQGCHIWKNEDRNKRRCWYKEAGLGDLGYEKKPGVVVYPHGGGFGPLSFSLYEEKLWDVKDIPGTPDPEKFKEAVREDVRAIGNIVKIKEDSWKIPTMNYPVNVLY